MSAPMLNPAFPGPTPPGTTAVADATPSVAFGALLGMMFGSQDGLAAQLLAGAAPGEKAEGETTDPATTDGAAEAQGLAAAFLTAPIIPPSPTTAGSGEGVESETGSAGAPAASVTTPGAGAGDPAELLAGAVDQDGAPALTVAAEKQKSTQEGLTALLKGENAAEAAASTLPAAGKLDTPPVEAAKLLASKVEAPPVPTQAPAASNAKAATSAAPVAPAVQGQGSEPSAAGGTTPAARAESVATPAAGGDGAQNDPGGGEMNKSSQSASAELARPKAQAERDEPQSHTPVTGAALQSAAAPVTHSAVPVRGSPETVAHLAAQIAKQLEGRSTHFDIALTPAGLGRVDVRVEISAHGQLTAAMSFDNPNAAAELRGRAGELARALEQAGFDLSGGLSFDVAGDRGQAGQGAAHRDDNHSASRGRAFQAALDVAGDTADAALGAALNHQRRSSTGVDIRI